jgi:acetylornithine deacetylase/succinyl-diaminopimelate desuccinylase-like protein
MNWSFALRVNFAFWGKSSMARAPFPRPIFVLMAFLFFAAPGHAQTVPTSPQYGPAASSSLSQIQADALGWLQGLLRIDTTNPPGNELVAAKYIAAILQKEGIPSEIFESTPGRGFIVARLSSSAVPDPSRALLLIAHLDVVGVDKSKWTVDPFAATIKDGYLYGRGAIDDKGMLAANVAVFVQLKRSGARLNRDVIFFAEGDEESYGTNGVVFAVDKHWDKIAAGYAINEGGHVFTKDGKPQYVAVQVSEKVPANVDVIAKGSSGHASMPTKDNPVTHLAAAIEKIGGYEAPVQFNSVTRAYFQAIAPLQDEETSKWMRSLDTSDRGEHAAKVISSDSPLWNAMLRDTVSPTVLQAGFRANVIPSEARGVVNIRLLPGNQLAPLLAKFQQLVNDPAIRFEPELPLSETAPSSSLTSDFYNTISSVAARSYPGIPVIPFMSPGCTDSTSLRLRNVQAYGLLPFALSDDDFSRFHGDNERISLDAFHKGVEFLFAIVNDFSVTK